jgi:BlaI family transcriptional regulator, penicillinase repressor
MGQTKTTLSRREREAMDVLYRRGQATVAEVMEDMAHPPTYSAVRSTLRILEEKGHVVHREDGPRYVYVPAVARDKARTAAIDHLVDTFFEGSADEALVALLKRSDLEMSEQQIERLAHTIRRAREEGR